MLLGIFLAVVLVVGAHSATALAGSPRSPTENAGTCLRDVFDRKRSIPEFGGTDARAPLGAELLAWGPRTLLLPLHTALEHGVRRPFGALVTLAEHHRVPQKVRRLLTWGPGARSFVVPTALIDFGLRPSIGLYLSSDDWWYRGGALRIHVATGGAGWYRVSTSVRHWSDQASTRALEVHAEVERRTDPLFWGIGPRVPDSSRRRYARTLLDAHVAALSMPWQRSRVETWFGIRRAWFDDDGGGLFVRGSSNAMVEPHDFGSGYLLATVGLRAALDSRSPRAHPLRFESDAVHAPVSGVRVAARVELAGGPRFGLEDGSRARRVTAFVRRGAKVGGSVEVFPRRVLSAWLTFDAVEPMVSSDDPIPFTELATLGGQHPLRGFLPGRLIGRTAVSATLEYAWPVWVWLDGVAHYGVGNAFGAGLDGASFGALRQSFGIGMRTVFGGEHRFELLIAAGTRPLDEGGEPESLRFVVGSALDL